MVEGRTLKFKKGDQVFITAEDYEDVIGEIVDADPNDPDYPYTVAWKGPNGGAWESFDEDELEAVDDDS